MRVVVWGMFVALAAGCVDAGRRFDEEFKQQTTQNLREVWRFQGLPLDIGRSSPLHAVKSPSQRLPAVGTNGEVYIHDRGILRAVTAANGTERWKKDLTWKGEVQYGECAGDIVLFGIEEGTGALLLLDRATGVEHRRRRGLPDGLLVVEGGRIYVVNPSFVGAYDPATLRSFWEIDYARAAFERRWVTAFQVRGRAIAMETFHEEFGYPRVLGIDDIGGGVRWDSLGHLGAVGDGVVYALKPRYGEVWARDGSDGRLIAVQRLDRFGGAFLDVVEGDMIYISEQRYYEPVDLLIDEKGATPVVRPTSHVREVIRYSPATGKTLWNIPCHREVVEGGFEVTARGDAVIVSERDAKGWRQITAVDKKEGKTVWNIRTPSDIVSFSAHGRYVVVAYRSGVTVCFAER